MAKSLYDLAQTSDQEDEASDRVVIARLKRDLKTLVRLVDLGGDSFLRAQAVSWRIEKRVDNLVDRTLERERVANLARDEAFWTGGKRLNEEWLRRSDG